MTVDVERWRDHYANAFGALSLVTCELRPISAWSPSDGRGGVTKVPFSSILAEEPSNLQGALEVVIIRRQVCPYIVVFDSDLVIVTLVTSNIMIGTQTNYIILSAKVIEIIC